MNAPIKPLFDQAELLTTYDEHPLQSAPILKRVVSIAGRAVTEMDLAIDHQTGITDQNHIGGVPFVLELADLAEVNSTTKVIDLGAGLGGSARLLADRYGCSVLAIDISPTRCTASRELTGFVNLQHLVQTECADITTVGVPRDSADLLWSQNSLLHIRDLAGLFSRWNGALVGNGKIALEDFFLLRPPALPHRQTAMAVLERSWLSYFFSFDAWKGALEVGGFRILKTVDVSRAVPTWLSVLRNASERLSTPPPERELAGWEAGRELAEAGVIGYFRILAAKIP
jgi:sarcosine/dimethylglycine N-methyltransferase